jgi:exodeoxyribonuclease X
MVAGELKPSEACALLASGRHEVLVAHNIDHEKHYVGTGVDPETDEERPWLCTYKTALRLWPEAPGHKLQELRYFLDLDSGVDFNPKLAEPPHRAGGDAYICAHLLRRLLQEAEKQEVAIDRLVKWSSGPALLVMCWMKKHKGKTWSQVAHDDRPYLEWIFDKSDVKDRDIRATVKYWLKQTAPPPQLV